MQSNRQMFWEDELGQRTKERALKGGLNRRFLCKTGVKLRECVANKPWYYPNWRGQWGSELPKSPPQAITTAGQPRHRLR